MKIFDWKKEKYKQAEEGEYIMNWPKWDDITKEKWEATYLTPKYNVDWGKSYSSGEAITYDDIKAAVKFLEEMPSPQYKYVLPVSPEILQELKNADLLNADYIGFQSFINGGVVFPNLKKTPGLHPRSIDKFDHLLEEG